MIDLLPDSLKDIAAAIGYENTLKIVQNYAGARLWIPRQPTLDWPLLLLLGYEAAFVLTGLCGGSQIEIPVCRSLNLAERNALIKADRATMTIGALAAKYQLRRGQIHRILSHPGFSSASIAP